VWVENLRSGEVRHTASAYLTFVGIDGQGNTVPLPPLLPETDEDRRRYQEAGARREYRLALKAKARK
jgi:acyl-CoA hydrolase